MKVRIIAAAVAFAVVLGLVFAACAGLTGTVRLNMVRVAGVWMICDLKLDLRGAAPLTGGDGYAQA